MAGRIITVAICAVFLALLVIRNAFVEAYGVQDPSRAAAIWPGHPSIVLAAGLTEVGASAVAARPVNPATIRQMEEASARAPLAPEPFLVRGVEAQLAGDAPLALRAFLAARERDPRSVAARYFLADYYLKTGQTQEGLAEISALTRLIPQSLGGIVPQLAAFARMSGGREQVRVLLRDQPQLEPWLLYELAAMPNDAHLALSLWSGRSTDQDRAWQQRLVNMLVSVGRFEEARAAWTRFDPQVRPVGELVDPRFELRAMPPFGWALASGPAGVAEPEGGGQLHILYYGRDDLVLASQLMLLKPGTYRLAMRVGGAQPAAKSLSWVIRCTQPARELTSIPFSSTQDGMLVTDITIPPQGCAAQALELTGKAPELPEQADLTISNLQLSRKGS